MAIELTVRAIGLGIAIFTFVMGAKAFGPDASLSRGAQNIDYPRLLWFVFLGIPGLYIAAKGMTFGPTAATNRMKGLAYVGAGLGLMVVAVGASYVASVVTSIIYGPSMVLGVGAFFTGGAAIIVGLIAVITGEDMRDAVKKKRKLSQDKRD